MYDNYILSISRLTNLHDVKQALVFDIWKLNHMRRIHNTLQLDNVIGDVLEWRPTINHHVKDTAQRPHVAGSADLEGEQKELRQVNKAKGVIYRRGPRILLREYSGPNNKG